jgi:hypothetical protein
MPDREHPHLVVQDDESVQRQETCLPEGNDQLANVAVHATPKQRMRGQVLDVRADGAGRQQYTTLYRMAVGHVSQAHATGVKILAGTGASDTYVFPGFGIHDELVEFVRAGLTPAEAIRSATIDATAFAGMEEEYGSTETGKAGDLLLLDANPPEDVRHTHAIVGLFLAGKYLDRAALDDLLAFAEQQAGSVRTNLHLLWSGLNSPLLRVQAAD